jgi:hypothetical protein
VERFDELKQKYPSVWNVIPTKGVSLSLVNMQDAKLFIQGACPSPRRTSFNTRPIHGEGRRFLVEDLAGNGAHLAKIIEANPGCLVDANSVIHPGDVLVIPPAA